MDARPLFKKHVIPALEKSRINAIQHWVQWATEVLRESISKKEIKPFKKVSNGLVATGDKFIADKNAIDNLCNELPGLCAVEMEGAAVAQVAYQERIPWLIVRVISDEADNNADQTFNEFLLDYQKFSWDLICSLLRKYEDAPWKEKFNFI